MSTIFYIISTYYCFLSGAGAAYASYLSQNAGIGCNFFKWAEKSRKNQNEDANDASSFC